MTGIYFEPLTQQSKKMRNLNIVSIDAETNGLTGKPFMVAGVAYKDGKEISRFVGRCLIEGEVDPWVAENVLPQLEGVEENYSSHEEMLRAFMEWHNGFQQWNSWDAPEGFQTLYHMGHVVEARVFASAQDMGIIGAFDAPYCPIEVASTLQSKGFRPDSVDSYMESQGLPKPEIAGGTHNALYDSLVAAEVYFDLIK